MNAAAESPTALLPFDGALAPVDPSDGPAWHAWRAGGIGASECAAALGLSPWMTPFELYLRKTGLLPAPRPSDAMRMGLCLEPAILAAYARRTGRAIVASQVCVQSADRPFLRATLDAVDDQGAVVELKASGWRQAGEWGEEGDGDAIPVHHAAQVQQQLLITGAPAARVAVLLGLDDFRVYDVAPDPGVHARMAARLEAFWRCVLGRRPPPMAEADAPLLLRVAPTLPESVDLGGEGLRLALEWEGASAAASDASKARDAAKAALVRLMGEHAVGLLPDGRQVVRKVVERAGYTAEASSYVDTRIKAPRERR